MKHSLHYLKKELGSNWHDFAIILFGGIIFLIAIMSFRGNPHLQFATSIAFTLFYIMWGAYHHVFEKNFHRKNFLEYVVVGLLFIAILYLVIF